MATEAIVAIAVVAFFVLLRHFAARRVLAGHGRFVWLMFLPTLLVSAALLWVPIEMFTTAPLLGALAAIISVIYASLLLRLLIRLNRSVNAAGPQGDIASVIAEPLGEYMVSLFAVVLIGALVAVVTLIVWAVSQRAI